MGSVTPAPPKPLLAALRHKADIRVFVETGTAAGDTADLVGDVFDTVITMEADTALYEAAHERLSGRKGILPLAGDSRELLPNLLPRLAQPAVFWLGTRVRDGASPGQGDQCPLLAEIAAITASPLPHVILIANARFFTAPPPPPRDPAHWPSLADILKALGQGMPRDAAIRDNILIAIARSGAGLWDDLFPDGRPEFLAAADA
uniref:Uncharacterized protein n=1 Tax=Desulfovibrio sp. U5L TaxID=596152 RepID=I2Q4H8_9BACT